MTLSTFLNRLTSEPDNIEFETTLSVIDSAYVFTPTAFTNGDCQNAVDQNNGSCKILAFGQLNGLTKEQTLACFGKFYREDVLTHPTGTDHQNIRNFIQHGWQGVTFSGSALTPK